MKGRYTKEQLKQIMVIKKQLAYLDNELGGSELELLKSESLTTNKKKKLEGKPNLPLNKHNTHKK